MKLLFDEIFSIKPLRETIKYNSIQIFLELLVKKLRRFYSKILEIRFERALISINIKPNCLSEDTKTQSNECGPDC